MLDLTPLEVYVNQIVNEGIVIHGIAALDKTVNENIAIIYKGKMYEVVTYLIKNSKDSFYSFDRFCQYVIYLQYHPIIGLTMKLSDFKDNTDAALEEYQLLRANAWEKKDTDRIMKIFQEIQHDKTNTARMVIKDRISSF